MRKLQEMQKQLDSTLAGNKRTGDIIRRSLVAEIIEFDETTKWTHKTWKNKEKPRAMQLEELVDCLFFIAQLFNHYDMEMANNWEVQEKEYNYHSAVNRLMVSSLTDNPFEIFKRYKKLAEFMGFTEMEIKTEYARKWKYNMKREDHNRI